MTRKDHALTAAVLAACAAGVAVQHGNAPASWAAGSAVVWLCYVLAATAPSVHDDSTPPPPLSPWDRRALAWGVASAALFAVFATAFDPDFKTWGDVYYFCGERHQYCTCDYRWNVNGWTKAATLWSFALSAALGAQKLACATLLGGLLPGEDVVARESFVSVCWRLIPYWLNAWEQAWGAEASSATFELPHFAAELVVVLPLVQVVAARLKILALPPGRGLVPAPLEVAAREGLGGGAGGDDDGAGARADAAAPAPAPPPHRRHHHPDLAPSILTGTWRVDPSQRTVLGRLRANRAVLAAVVTAASLAALNALVVPLRLEASALAHPRTPAVMEAAVASDRAWRTAGLGGLPAAVDGVAAAYSARCGLRAATPASPFRAATLKHAAELAKMRAPEHAELIPLLEAALAIMRLSCEKFFVLATVLAAHVLFRGRAPRAARALIRANHRLSAAFQRVILYSFPAVCWLHGAGFVFSAFVSVVFWGAPVQRAVDALRKRATIVRPTGLRDASAGEVERANGSCAVCWGGMGAPPSTSAAAAAGLLAGGGAPLRLLGASGPPAQAPPSSSTARGPRGKALPCGHAFHGACIRRWLAQCHGQGRRPTCPMCNAVIELDVTYRFPLPWLRPTAVAPPVAGEAVAPIGAGPRGPPHGAPPPPPRGSARRRRGGGARRRARGRGGRLCSPGCSRRPPARRPRPSRHHR